jgi:hypothetical protein
MTRSYRERAPGASFRHGICRKVKGRIAKSGCNKWCNVIWRNVAFPDISRHLKKLSKPLIWQLFTAFGD